MFGRKRTERYVDPNGQPRKRVRHLHQGDREALIWEHHAGYIDRATFEQNQTRVAQNAWRTPEVSGAVREGSALFQGIVVCGRRGRRLKVHYDQSRERPAYHCPGTVLADGRGGSCLRVSGVTVDEAVAGALLEALTPRA